ncbi:hypothetical protein TNCV_972051 [Trichonephila clavipes]|nr:hypothetical protein TNCV_972051 [Trichonephila clavipes]
MLAVMYLNGRNVSLLGGRNTKECIPIVSHGLIMDPSYGLRGTVTQIIFVPTDFCPERTAVGVIKTEGADCRPVTLANQKLLRHGRG